MSYQVTLTATAVKERKRIDPVIRKRIDQALMELKLEPRPSGVKKLGVSIKIGGCGGGLPYSV